jgi:Ca2+/Na+ antiporter
MMKKFRTIELKFHEILIGFSFLSFFLLVLKLGIDCDAIVLSFLIIGIYQQLRFVLLPWRGDFKKHRIHYFILLVFVYVLPYFAGIFITNYGIINILCNVFYFLYCIFVMLYFYLICKRENQATTQPFKISTMKNKIIIYDDACPLCQAYTDAFIKYGLLSKDGRKPFSEIDERIIAKLDLERACNEIPLIDTQTHEVLYGIDAMVEVLNHTFPFVKPIASIAPMNWFLRKLYKLISYNRKGIVAKIPAIGKFNCAPSYSFNYKKFFIALCFTVSTIIMYCMFRKTFTQATDFIIMLSGFFVLISIFIQNKNHLEISMQWQLQLMIMCVVLIPVALLGQATTLGALLLACLLAILFIKQIYQRIVYLKYFIRSDQ